MNNNQQAILFVGGGQETIPGIEVAKSMDLHVVVSDMNPYAPCIKLADNFLLADTYDIEETLHEVRKYQSENRPFDGVICMATDVPLTVASIANEFGLPSIPIESAKIVSDKMLMKDCFKQHELLIPWYSEIYGLDDLKGFVEERGFPLVLKPVDSRGARGVLRLTDDVDLEWAYFTSRSFSPSDRIMLEDFLDGPQVSTESIVIEGKVFTIGFSDRNYEYLDKYAPHIIEDGGDLPSFLSNEDQNLITEAVEKTAAALKITDGVIKGDMVLSDGHPYIIEVATRLSGGYFCSHEIPLNTGIDFVRLAIKLAIGESISEKSLLACQNLPVSQRYFFPNPGVVKKIIVPDWIVSEPNIKLLEIRVSVGDLISEATHHPSRAGLVITSGTDKNDALKLAKNVVREVQIVTE